MRLVSVSRGTSLNRIAEWKKIKIAVCFYSPGDKISRPLSTRYSLQIKFDEFCFISSFYFSLLFFRDGILARKMTPLNPAIPTNISLREKYLRYKATVCNYLQLLAIFCSNRWWEPIRNPYPFNSALYWFSPTVAANSCTESCVVNWVALKFA